MSKKCPNCGAAINDGVFHCSQCGALLDGSEMENKSAQDFSASDVVEEPSIDLKSVVKEVGEEPQPETVSMPQPNESFVNVTPYNVWAILNALFCCLPLGLAGAVLANRAKKASTIEEAEKNIRYAKIVNIIGTIVGFFINIIYIGIRLQDF